jgi:hypothetical protein
MPDTNREIRDRIDEFLTQITALVHKAAVESVRAALGEGAPRPRKGLMPTGEGSPGGFPSKATRRRRARRKTTKVRPGRRTRRSAADLGKIAGKVRAYVRAHPGERLEEIGRGLRKATAGLKRPVQSLLAAGSLRTEGQKRGTRYFAGRGKGRRKAARSAARRPAGRKAGARPPGKAGMGSRVHAPHWRTHRIMSS